MAKLVALSINGEFDTGFVVQVEVRQDAGTAKTEVSLAIAGTSAKLPAHPELLEQYLHWKILYNNLESFWPNRLKPKPGVTNSSESDEAFEACKKAAQLLVKTLNRWLQSIDFQPIVNLLHEHLKDSTHTRILLSTENHWLRRLPWCEWQLLKDIPSTELVLASPKFKQIKTPENLVKKDKIRILVILGDNAGTDGDEAVIQDQKLIPNAEICWLKEPQRSDLDDPLWEKQWDILFFAGHGVTKNEGSLGKIKINAQDWLSIDEIRNHLKRAINKGLKLAIFNACDGLGIAYQLTEGEDLYLPQIIVMRELLPIAIAPKFLQYFLEDYTQGLSLYTALHNSRKRLQIHEKEFPCASWLPVLCQNPAEVPPRWWDWVIPPCPYRGLSAFQEEDAELFFGRERVINQLVEVVKDKKLVAVIGASGSGKSSVVLAGLIPRLRQQKNWLIASLRPGSTPFENLAKALQLPEQLLTQLQAGTCSLPDAIKSRSQSRTVLLVIDQFEEIYSYPNQQFLNCLLDAVENLSAFRLVITLRADFLGQAIKSNRFREQLDRWKPELIGAMEREQLQAVIEEPAKKRGVYLEPGLTEHILNDVNNESGYLPLLEFALTEMWDQQLKGCLTRKVYDDIGGIENALRKHAEEVYDQFNKKDQEQIKRIFIQLVSPGEGTEYIRRIATRIEIGEENWDLVTRLATGRLVVTNRNETTEIEIVEVVHEALIKAWPDLKTWIEEDDAFLRWKKRLQEALREWKKNNEKEGYLLQAAPLGEAEGYLQQRFEDINPTERLFINFSLEQEKARQQRELEQERKARKAAQTRTRIAIASTVIISGVSIFAFWQRNEAIKGQIKALVAEAEFRFSANDQLGAVLASVKAAQQLKQSFGLSANEELQTLVKIQQPIYKIQERNRFEGHSDSVEAVSFSPDGTLIASGSADKTVKLWSRDGTLLKTFEGHTGRVSSVSFSPDGKTIVSAGRDQTVRLWNLDGLLKKTMKVKGNLDISDVKFSPDGKLIASATRDGIIQVWGVDGTLFKIFVLEANGVDSISWNPNGNILAIANSSGVILIKNDGSILNYIKAYGEPGGGRVSFSPDGKTIAVANAVTRGNNGNNTVSLFDTNGKFLKTLGQEAASSQPGDLILDIQFSPDGKMIAASSGDRTVKILEVDSDEYLDLLVTFKGHIGSVNRISFSPDGKTIASASRDKTVRLWSIKYPNVLDAGSDVLSLRFNPDGKTLNTANLYQDGSIDYRATVKHWNIYGILLKYLNIVEPDFDRRPLRFNNVHFSNDGNLILITGKNKGFQLLDWSGNNIHTFDVIDKVRSSAFSSDGKLIATATSDNNIKLWNIDGKLIRSIPDNPNIYNIYFSPNNQNIVVVDDKQVRVLTLEGKLLTKINIEKGWLTIVAFSPDSKIITTADYHDQIIKLWNLDGKLIKSLTHKDQSRSVIPSVGSINFSPDGKMIATGYKDLNLWELDGDLIATIQGHGGDINNISFSPDGKIIGITEEYPTGEGNLGYIPSVTFWSRDLDSILRSGCNLLSDYLKTNPNVSESDKQLCDGVNNQP